MVGIFSYMSISGDPLAYANADDLSQQINLADQATSYRLVLSDVPEMTLTGLIDRVDRRLDDKGYQVESIQAGDIQRASATSAIDTVVYMLLAMALLTAIVSSIGLTGTMGINVLERTREIGVLRTIGAVDGAVMQTVVIEGLVIGVITWLIAIPLSYPISISLLTIIGSAMAGQPFGLTFDPMGVAIWLAIIVVLSLVASLTPALNAARLTINDALAYE